MTRRQTIRLVAACALATVAIFLMFDTARSSDGCGGFRWGGGGDGDGKCWTSKEGDAFATWLRQHGVSPKHWAQKYPELARTFGRNWPKNWERLNRSFPKAVAYSADRFRVSRSWLTSCAASEGGTNPGYIAVGSAGEHGWWQYLPGTFEFMSRSAFTVKGHPPRVYRDRDSLLGQAWTTAYAFSAGLSYHWYGSGC